MHPIMTTTQQQYEQTRVICVLHDSQSWSWKYVTKLMFEVLIDGLRNSMQLCCVVCVYFSFNSSCVIYFFSVVSSVHSSVHVLSSQCCMSVEYSGSNYLLLHHHNYLLVPTRSLARPPQSLLACASLALYPGHYKACVSDEQLQPWKMECSVKLFICQDDRSMNIKQQFKVCRINKNGALQNLCCSVSFLHWLWRR